ncbi:hypothetical protein [Anaerobiospirillum succiniciproducens]|uniref:hypothetical protein n=1 Tax=Anaerobiospirillum succiniciproducens TaxID=13335 RepID=UPI002942CD1B|nr:hypothetical protein [Anaerobiospirillum succiniciproducens]
MEFKCFECVLWHLNGVNIALVNKKQPCIFLARTFYGRRKKYVVSTIMLVVAQIGHLAKQNYKILCVFYGAVMRLPKFLD